MKKQKTKLQKYDKYERASKILGGIAPYIFIIGLVVCAVCLFFALRNSFGNLREMINLLNNKIHTGEELQANYNMLIEKYGEWVIGSGSTGFTIKFIDVRKVFFNGFALLSFFGCLISLFCSLVLGKWLFPKLAKKYERKSKNIVDREILRDK